VEKYKVIGLMSGTSMDGLDIAYCEFRHNRNKWEFRICEGKTVPFSAAVRKRLVAASETSALELARTHTWFGNWMGEAVYAFMNEHGLHPDLISSHGHTIFHQPQKGFTLQIGCGAALAAISGVDTVCDFRTLDIALGGQGAPLVPIGDELLFSGYDYCLNLGGFANVSYRKKGKRLAFDICPANIVLNQLSQSLHLPYDKGGLIARGGRINQLLLDKLNTASYYSSSGPKSLGREWVRDKVIPLLASSQAPVADKLRTYTEHIAYQISRQVGDSKASLLVTGGGAFNLFLMERIRDLSGIPLALPEDNIIHFREALIFAFLGVLRIRNEVNCLKSVTGARQDSSGGCVYKGLLPKV
jgi:anhydro-N-acetylmuramic acid kinase